MTRPLDDLHPIEREVFVQADEDMVALGAVANDVDSWRPLMASYGIADRKKQNAIVNAVNRSCRSMAQEERRRFRNPKHIACETLLNILLGIRLARKGLV